MSPFSRTSGWARLSDHTDENSSPHISDDVVAGARAGNRAQMELVLKAYAGYAGRVLYRLAGPTPDLDDLHQTALIRIATGLATFQGKSSLKTWITTVCLHVVQEHFRSGRMRRKHEETTDEMSELARDGAPSAQDTVEAREELALMRKALAKLSRVQRTAFVLQTLGHSVEEIAAMMKSAKSTTRLRLYYGRKKLAAVLAELRKPGGES